jgi:hypothetical protein
MGMSPSGYLANEFGYRAVSRAWRLGCLMIRIDDLDRIQWNRRDLSPADTFATWQVGDTSNHAYDLSSISGIEYTSEFSCSAERKIDLVYCCPTLIQSIHTTHPHDCVCAQTCITMLYGQVRLQDPCKTETQIVSAILTIHGVMDIPPDEVLARLVD